MNFLHNLKHVEKIFFSWEKMTQSWNTGVIKENYNNRYGELLKIKETVYAEDDPIFCSIVSEFATLWVWTV